MSTKQLAETITEGGLRAINFFNGRLLSGEDLSQEQAAHREGRRLLGLATGEGIVSGLQVAVLSDATVATTRVRVLPGLALNRLGEIIRLSTPTEVALVPPRDTPTAQTDLFVECRPSGEASPLITGGGIYVLTIAPASSYQGRAQVSGLGESAATGQSCGSRYKVEGVRFGLVWLRLDNTASLPGVSLARLNELAALMNAGDPPSLSKLRNLLAHICFDTEQRASLPIAPLRGVDPLSLYDQPGPLDNLRTLGRLADCEVPLALLYWTGSGVQFLDMGAVRRRPMPGPPTNAWPLSVGGGYPATGEAISLQFQEQLAELTRPSVLPSQLSQLEAHAHFRYLPAAGLIPISGFQSSRGFNYGRFFQGIEYRQPFYLEGAAVEHLLRDSLDYPPIDLTSGEMVWLYLVRQNIEALNNGQLNPPQAYLIFSSGFMSYRGAARYDLNRYNYANYALTQALPEQV